MLLRNESLHVLNRFALRAAWFPDGKKLLFVHIGRDGTTLYRIGADGGGLREVAREHESDRRWCELRHAGGRPRGNADCLQPRS